LSLNALWEYANPLKFIRTAVRALPVSALAARAARIGAVRHE